MSNGAKAHWAVSTILQRGDDTLLAHVNIGSLPPGQEVEVSIYLTQDDLYAAHYEKKHIPFPDPKNPGEPTVLHVELPATKLDAGKDVTVVTRVAEVWPSVLKQDPTTTGQIKEAMGEYMDQSPKAVWTYQESEGNQESEGKEPGGPESPLPGDGGGSDTMSQQP